MMTTKQLAALGTAALTLSLAPAALGQIGACCLGNASCVTSDAPGCATLDGAFIGEGTDCADVVCEGACCSNDGSKGCFETSSDGCTGLGDFQGAQTTCDVTCPTVLGTGFGYQGQLKQDGVPLNGTIDVEFSLHPAPVTVDQIGADYRIDAVPVVNGLFNVYVDFGAEAFGGSARWLEVRVRTPHDPTGVEPFITLDPRQEISPTPYALQTRGIFVDEANNVGIGTTNPEHKLHVEADSATFGSAAISGRHAANSGTNYGVQGHSNSMAGRGVFGWASATSGQTSGVWGQSVSPSGRGVFGWASAVTGTTYGGWFRSESTSGRGVFGEAVANSGTTSGGRFQSSSTSGRGVFGLAIASTGVNYGVWGLSNSSSGFDFYASGAGTNYGSSSSIRWKNNVEPIDRPLEKIAQLRGVYYDWDAEHGGHHDVGMIAEEVGKILPEIVNYEENGIDAIGMDYSKLTPLLVEAVNALRAEKDAQITALKEDNDKLRERLVQLESIVAQLAAEAQK